MGLIKKALAAAGVSAAAGAATHSGIIGAAAGAAGGVLADSWKEFFYCDSIPADVLVVKGQKRADSRSANKKGTDNVITNGSIIAVADGQCMLIVDQGMIVDLCAEPGEYVFDQSSEPSLWMGSLGETVKASFESMKKRFTFGGQAAKDQRVYYINIKELVDNKFGTRNPIPFRAVDNKIGLDMDTAVRCSGVYSYTITDPLLFYKNVCGNVADRYTREALDNQLKTEFVSALQPAFGRLSQLEMRPNQIVSHTAELEEEMNRALSEKWGAARGLKIVSIAIGSVTLPDEDAQVIKDLQRTAVMQNPGMAGAALVNAQAEALKTAAGNPNGAMMGFMGMGMAAQAGGMDANALFAMNQQNQAAAQAAQQSVVQQPKMQAPTQAAGAWKCSCGADASGNFCMECGAKKPAENGWACSCGQVNKGRFCPNCGAKKPAGALLYKCDKCGWTPEDPAHPPKFCPECGDPFDDRDVQ